MRTATGLISFLTMFAVGCGVSKSKNDSADATGSPIPVDESQPDETLAVPGDQASQAPKDEAKTPKAEEPAKKGEVTPAPKGEEQAPPKVEEPKGEEKGTAEQGKTEEGKTPEQGKVEQGTPEQGTPEQGTVEQGTVQQGTVQQGTTEQGTAEQGTTQQGTVQQGTPEQGTPEQGTPEQGKVGQGTQPTQPGTVQHEDATAVIQAKFDSDGRDGVTKLLDERIAALQDSAANLTEAERTEFADQIAAVKAAHDNLPSITDDAEFVKQAAMVLDSVNQAKELLASRSSEAQPNIVSGDMGG